MRYVMVAVVWVAIRWHKWGQMFKANNLKRNCHGSVLDLLCQMGVVGGGRRWLGGQYKAMVAMGWLIQCEQGHRAARSQTQGGGTG